MTFLLSYDDPAKTYITCMDWIGRWYARRLMLAMSRIRLSHREGGGIYVVEVLNEMRACLYVSYRIFGPCRYVDLVNGFFMVNHPDASHA